MPKVDRENCLNNRGSALEKAIKVLNVLTTSDRPLALTEIAERLNLPRQTIHRVVQSLAQNQLALRAPHRGTPHVSVTASKPMTALAGCMALMQI